MWLDKFLKRDDITGALQIFWSRMKIKLFLCWVDKVDKANASDGSVVDYKYDINTGTLIFWHCE